ncbi:MAG: aminoacetone oxidase family FAD-binding enzyme [bacterium]|nr:aminoacetone oxidase family FAD-binding enzyme [bacterium]
MNTETADVVIVGAGAAGLMAGIFAGRTNPRRRIMLLDGAKKIGAKILVAGGGRCNVTHDHVDETAYAGASRNAIRKVLRRFDVPETTAFFQEIGVRLKREDTGKLFPTTDDAHTVLEALIAAAQAVHTQICTPYRVEAVVPLNGGFRVSGVWGALECGAVILATGGKSLPKSGSDGGGYALARALGHSVTQRVFPALVPLTLPRDHFLTGLSGIAVPAALEVRAGTGKKIAAFTNALLCTHFGLSGPAALDISRYFTAARLDDPAAHLIVNWLPHTTTEAFDHDLQTLGSTSLMRFLSEWLPERLARALADSVHVNASRAGESLRREERRALASCLTAMPLPITGDRGFTYAEVTAGGVPLSEIRLDTMESRKTAGLYFCGELCDVDGRIGGYNFQWAWSSGYVAGVSVR